MYSEELYEGLTNPASDAAWSSALPNGDGFVYIDQPEKYGLPAGANGDMKRTKYGVSWTHQYHCLVSVLISMLLKCTIVQSTLCMLIFVGNAPRRNLAHSAQSEPYCWA